MTAKRVEDLRTRVVVIGADAKFSLELCLLIENHESFSVVRRYDADCLATLHFKRDKPEIVILDSIGSLLIEVVDSIKRFAPDARVIIVASKITEQQVFNAFRQGVIGFLVKPIHPCEVVKSMELLIAGEYPINSQIVKLLVDRLKVSSKTPLTKRETEIMLEIAKGKTYTKIARDLEISKDTARAHIRNIYLKLEARSKSEAIFIAQKNKYI